MRSFSLLLVLFFSSALNKVHAQAPVNHDSIYNDLAQISQQFRRSNLDSSLHYAQLAKNYCLVKQLDSVIAGAFYLESIAYYFQGKYSLALNQLDSGLHFAKLVSDSSRIGNLLSVQGSIKNRLGQFPEAEKDLLASLAVYEKLRVDEKTAVALGNLGNLYSDMGELKKGLEYTTRAYNIYSALNDSSKIAINLNNLALVYFDNGFYDKAKTLFQEKIKISKAINDTKRITSGLTNLGDVYFDLNEMDSAQVCFDKALELAMEFNSSENIVYALLGKVRIALKRDDIPQAKQDLDSAYTYIEGNKNKFLLLNYFQYQGEILFHLGKHKESIDWYKHALSFAHNLNSSGGKLNALQGLGNANKKLQNYKELAENFEAKSNLLDSIQKEKTANQITILEWENEQKIFENIRKSEGKIKALETTTSNLQFFIDRLTGLMVILSFLSLLIVFWQLYKRKKKEVEIADIARTKAESEKDLFQKIEQGKALTLELVNGFMEGTQSVMAFFDKTLALIDANNALTETVGEPKEKLLNQNIQSIFPCIDHKIIQSIQEVQVHGKNYQFQLNLALKQENETTFNFFVFKIGDRIGLQMHDVSTFKNVEKELINARNEALQALSAKTQFLGTINHELRTPLNGILGLSRICLEHKLPKETREYVELIAKSGDVLLSLINNVLDFAKIENGKIERELMVFSLTDQIQDVASVMSILAQEKRIKLSSHIPPNLYIRSDPTAIKQIFYNIFSNAVKFTESGEIICTGATELNERGQTLFVCTISDTGIGIPEDRIEGLFTPFTQVDSSTTRKFGGTGLGLSIVNEIITDFGGTIHIESKLNEGTKIHFKIPVEVPNLAEVLEITDEANSIDLKGKSILLVEDQKVNQLIIAKNLEKWQAHFDIANNGKEGVELFDTQNYDLVLMDLHMPVMDGLEASTLMKSKKDTPIILLTADSNLEIDEKLFQLALIKPINSDSLLKSIGQVLTKHLSENGLQD